MRLRMRVWAIMLGINTSSLEAWMRWICASKPVTATYTCLQLRLQRSRQVFTTVRPHSDKTRIMSGFVYHGKVSLKCREEEWTILVCSPAVISLLTLFLSQYIFLNFPLSFFLRFFPLLFSSFYSCLFLFTFLIRYIFLILSPHFFTLFFFLPWSFFPHFTHNYSFTFLSFVLYPSFVFIFLILSLYLFIYFICLLLCHDLRTLFIFFLHFSWHSFLSETVSHSLLFFLYFMLYQSSFFYPSPPHPPFISLPLFCLFPFWQIFVVFPSFSHQIRG
jgi:hypothetical protein